MNFVKDVFNSESNLMWILDLVSLNDYIFKGSFKFGVYGGKSDLIVN